MKKLFIKEDFNGHVGTTKKNFERVHQDFRYSLQLYGSKHFL
jgi:hypothetical protein